jgi:hypothetical protein
MPVTRRSRGLDLEGLALALRRTSVPVAITSDAPAVEVLSTSLV